MAENAGRNTKQAFCMHIGECCSQKHPVRDAVQLAVIRKSVRPSTCLSSQSSSADAIQAHDLVTLHGKMDTKCMHSSTDSCE